MVRLCLEVARWPGADEAGTIKAGKTLFFFLLFVFFFSLYPSLLLDSLRATKNNIITASNRHAADQGRKKDNTNTGLWQPKLIGIFYSL